MLCEENCEEEAEENSKWQEEISVRKRNKGREHG